MGNQSILKVLFSWATKPEDCICVLTPYELSECGVGVRYKPALSTPHTCSPAF